MDEKRTDESPKLHNRIAVATWRNARGRSAQRSDVRNMAQPTNSKKIHRRPRIHRTNREELKQAQTLQQEGG